jgi:hypothetical protein
MREKPTNISSRKRVDAQFKVSLLDLKSFVGDKLSDMMTPCLNALCLRIIDDEAFTRGIWHFENHIDRFELCLICGNYMYSYFFRPLGCVSTILNICFHLDIYPRWLY